MVQDAKRHPDTRQVPSIGHPPDPEDLSGFLTWHVHAGTTCAAVTTSGLGPWWFSSDGQGRFDLGRPGAPATWPTTRSARCSRSSAPSSWSAPAGPPLSLWYLPARPVPGRRHHRAVRGASASPPSWPASRPTTCPSCGRRPSPGPAGRCGTGSPRPGAPGPGPVRPGGRAVPVAAGPPPPRGRRTAGPAGGRDRHPRGARAPGHRPAGGPGLSGSARRDDVVDVVHGVPVPDPYRWLEDGDDPDTRAWVAAENARTRAALDGRPERGRAGGPVHRPLLGRHRGAPSIRGGRLFSIDRWPGHEQAVLVVRDAHGDGPPRPHCSTPHEATGDPTAALDWYSPSKDGRLVAYGISTGGDERSTLGVLDVATGERLADSIHRAASVEQAPDGTAFAYSRYPDPAAVGEEEANYNRTIRWHILGDDPGHDEVVFADLPDKTAWPSVELSRTAAGWSSRCRSAGPGSTSTSSTAPPGRDRHRGHGGGVVVHGPRRPTRGHDQPRRPAGPGVVALASPPPSTGTRWWPSPGTWWRAWRSRQGRCWWRPPAGPQPPRPHPLAALDGDGPVVPDDIRCPSPGPSPGWPATGTATRRWPRSRRGPGRPSCGGGRPPSRAATACAGGATWPPRRPGRLRRGRRPLPVHRRHRDHAVHRAPPRRRARASPPTLLTGYGGFAVTMSPGLQPGGGGGGRRRRGVRGGLHPGRGRGRRGLAPGGHAGPQAAGVRRPRRPPTGWWPGGGRAGTAWPSAAAATAGCWWRPR